MYCKSCFEDRLFGLKGPVLDSYLCPDMEEEALQPLLLLVGFCASMSISSLAVGFVAAVGWLIDNLMAASSAYSVMLTEGIGSQSLSPGSSIQSFSAQVMFLECQLIPL